MDINRSTQESTSLNWLLYKCVLFLLVNIQVLFLCVCVCVHERTPTLFLIVVRHVITWPEMCVVSADAIALYKDDFKEVKNAVGLDLIDAPKEMAYDPSYSPLKKLKMWFPFENSQPTPSKI